MVEKMKRSERAKQFLPFDSLKGFYDLVHQEEKIITPRRILTDDELAILSYQYQQLAVGKMVTIEHYVVDGYVKTEGMIAKIDEVYHTITIVNTVISFADIVAISAPWLKDYIID